MGKGVERGDVWGLESVGVYVYSNRYWSGRITALGEISALINLPTRNKESPTPDGKHPDRAYQIKSIEVATNRPILMIALTLKKALLTRSRSSGRTRKCS